MERIADWLEKLGMSEYAQRFVENRIDLRSFLISRIKTLRSWGSYSVIAARCSARSAISTTSRLPLRRLPRPWSPSQLGEMTPSVAS
jgi:hypothetical protein